MIQSQLAFVGLFGQYVDEPRKALSVNIRFHSAVAQSVHPFLKEVDLGVQSLQQVGIRMSGRSQDKGAELKFWNGKRKT